jgi:hypothetical protein
MIYTAIIGDYDVDRNDIPIFRNKIFIDDKRTAGQYKILSHQYINDKVSIWIDGNIYLHSFITEEFLINKYLKNCDIAVLKHPIRNCIYREAIACQQYQLDDEELIQRQMIKYRIDGYPSNNGLAALPIIIRKHTKKIIELNNLWWSEVCSGSRRDQLSFDYVCWKLKIKYGIIDGGFPDNKLFHYNPHRKTHKFFQ